MFRQTEMWKETIYFVTLKVWALVSEKTKERSCLEVLNRTSVLFFFW